MRVSILFVIFILIFIINFNFSQDIDFSLNEIPCFTYGIDKNGSNYISILNTLDGGIRFDLNDNIYIKSSLKLNLSFFSLGTNNIFNFIINLDNLESFINLNVVKIRVGRYNFADNEGAILANVADGIELSSSLFSFEQNLKLFYSGLLKYTLADELDKFKFTSLDGTDGSKRLGIYLNLLKRRFIFNSISGGVYAILDLSTNASVSSNNIYLPIYTHLNINGKLPFGINYVTSGYLQFGNIGTNQLFASSIIGSFVFNVLPDNLLTVVASTGYASGDVSNTVSVSERFETFGSFNPAKILKYKFSNMYFGKVNLASTLLDGYLSLNAHYLFMGRLSLYDTVYNQYKSNQGGIIGQEIYTEASWSFDPNMILSVNGGVSLIGDALAVSNQVAPRLTVILTVMF